MPNLALRLFELADTYQREAQGAYNIAMSERIYGAPEDAMFYQLLAAGWSKQARMLLGVEEGASPPSGWPSTFEATSEELRR